MNAKKPIGYLLLVLVCYYGYRWYIKVQEEASWKKEENDLAQEQANAKYAATHPHTNAELQQIAFKAAANRNLPVYAKNFKGVTTVTREEWPTFNQYFCAGSSKGDDYATQINRIERLSSQSVKSGIYKSEFNNIRSALLARTKW